MLMSRTTSNTRQVLIFEQFEKILQNMLKSRTTSNTRQVLTFEQFEKNPTKYIKVQDNL